MAKDFLPMNICRCFALALLFSAMAGCRLGGSPSEHLQKAEELSRQKLYDQAIDEYRKHMNERLKVKNRPEWENPYFYLVLIGDIQLGLGKPDQARSDYDEAQERGVDVALVSDRYRSLALWYEQNDQLQKASDILTSRRHYDPIIFDSILDRISKEIVRREDLASSSSSEASKSKKTVTPVAAPTAGIP